MCINLVVWRHLVLSLKPLPAPPLPLSALLCSAWVFVVICALNGKLLIRFLACRVTLSSSPRRRCRRRRPLFCCCLPSPSLAPSFSPSLYVLWPLTLSYSKPFAVPLWRMPHGWSVLAVAFVSKLVNVIAVGPLPTAGPSPDLNYQLF